MLYATRSPTATRGPQIAYSHLQHTAYLPLSELLCCEASSERGRSAVAYSHLQHTCLFRACFLYALKALGPPVLEEALPSRMTLNTLKRGSPAYEALNY